MTMTFEQWAKARGYRLTKRLGFYTSPATRAVYLAWQAGEQAERSRAASNKLKVVA